MKDTKFSHNQTTEACIIILCRLLFRTLIKKQYFIKQIMKIKNKHLYLNKFKIDDLQGKN